MLPSNHIIVPFNFIAALERRRGAYKGRHLHSIPPWGASRTEHRRAVVSYATTQSHDVGRRKYTAVTTPCSTRSFAVFRKERVSFRELGNTAFRNRQCVRDMAQQDSIPIFLEIDDADQHPNLVLLTAQTCACHSGKHSSAASSTSGRSTCGDLKAAVMYSCCSSQPFHHC